MTTSTHTTVQSIIVNELGDALQDALRFTAELAALVAAGGALFLWLA